MWRLGCSPFGASSTDGMLRAQGYGTGEYLEGLNVMGMGKGDNALQSCPYCLWEWFLEETICQTARALFWGCTWNSPEQSQRISYQCELIRDFRYLALWRFTLWKYFRFRTSTFWISTCFFLARYQCLLAFRVKRMAMAIIIIIVIKLGELLPSSVTVLQVYVTEKSVNVVRKEGTGSCQTPHVVGHLDCTG